MQPLTIIFLSYGLPSLLCYVLVLIAMARLGKTLASSFRCIFFVTACFNLATYINTWLVTRLRSEPFFFFYYEWVNGVGWFRNLQQIGLSHFYLAQNLCVLLLTIDRFVAIFSLYTDLEIKEIWTRFFWIVVLVAHCLLVGLSAWTRCPTNSWYVLDVSGAFYTTQRDPSENPNIHLNRIVQAIFGACVLVICSLMNTASLYQLYCLRINRNTKSSPLTILRHEYSLFVLSLSVFLAQSLSFIFVLIMNLSDFHPDQLQTHSMLMMFTSDIFSLSPAIYTLFVRGPIRNQVVLLFKKPLILSTFNSSDD